MTGEGAHSCAPRVRVLRWSFAVRDILATRNGRPPLSRDDNYSLQRYHSLNRRELLMQRVRRWTIRQKSIEARQRTLHRYT